MKKSRNSLCQKENPIYCQRNVFLTLIIEVIPSPPIAPCPGIQILGGTSAHQHMLTMNIKFPVNSFGQRRGKQLVQFRKNPYQSPIFINIKFKHRWLQAHALIQYVIVLNIYWCSPHNLLTNQSPAYAIFAFMKGGLCVCVLQINIQPSSSTNSGKEMYFETKM